LQPGDSGAWVVDAETNEVYGHVIASDVFGRAYVIPIADIFLDIHDRLSAQSVCLAFIYGTYKTKFQFEMADSNPGSMNNYQDSKNNPPYPSYEPQPAYPDSAYASMDSTPAHSPQVSEGVVTEGTEASQTDAHHPEQRVYGSGHDSGYVSRNLSSNSSPEYLNAPQTHTKKRKLSFWKKF
jgi:hypothetical protein